MYISIYIYVCISCECCFLFRYVHKSNFNDYSSFCINIKLFYGGLPPYPSDGLCFRLVNLYTSFPQFTHYCVLLFVM